MWEAFAGYEGVVDVKFWREDGAEAHPILGIVGVCPVEEKGGECLVLYGGGSIQSVYERVNRGQGERTQVKYLQN